MDASNALSEGEEISHKDACDLVVFWRQEHDRVVQVYQDRMVSVVLDLANLINKIYPK